MVTPISSGGELNPYLARANAYEKHLDAGPAGDRYLKDDPTPLWLDNLVRDIVEIDEIKGPDASAIQRPTPPTLGPWMEKFVAGMTAGAVVGIVVIVLRFFLSFQT